MGYQESSFLLVLTTFTLGHTIIYLDGFYIVNMFRGKVCLRIIYLFPNVRSPAQTTPVLRRSVFSGQHVRRAEGSEPSSETPSSQGKEVETVVSSLRIDAVAAAGLDISRKYVGLIIDNIYLRSLLGHT